MLHKLITKKLIYFNLSIIISLFFLSFFFKPNLTLKIQYRFNNILINEKLLILNEILDEGVLSDPRFVNAISVNQLKDFIYRYFQYLADEKNERVYKNCPTEITKAYFKDVRVDKIGRFSDKFSVEIKYNSPSKSAEEEIKKCFQVIFVEQLNNYYLENVEIVKKIISDLVVQNNHEPKNKNLSRQTNDIKTEEIVNAFITANKDYKLNSINYLNDIKYFIHPQSQTKPIIIKNSVDHVMFYLAIILLFFIIQIFYICSKIFLNLKKL
jgi:hypothetical protein